MKYLYLGLALVVVGCAGTPAEQTAATGCNSAATIYMEAAIARKAGKLSASQISLLTSLEKPIAIVCDPTNPPTNSAAALSDITTYVNQLSAAGLTTTGVK